MYSESHHGYLVRKIWGWFGWGFLNLIGAPKHNKRCINGAANQLTHATQNTDVPYQKNTPQTISEFLQNFSQILMNSLPKSYSFSVCPPPKPKKMLKLQENVSKN